MSEPNRLYAFETNEQDDMPITVAPFGREWMDNSPSRFAYRCLPLVIANQAGWLIHNPTSFSAVWNGGERPEDVQIDFKSTPVDPHNFAFQMTTFTVDASTPASALGEGRPDGRIRAHFGCGIVTFSIPYLFRTPPSINLWVKGPANLIKDGVQPLEGVVESDWMASTFTMNWKLTRRNHRVRFEAGEPICMIVPVPRRVAEELEPIRLPMNCDPEVDADYSAWQRSRSGFLVDVKTIGSEAHRRGWQKDYFQGKTPTGKTAEEHQTRLDLKEFRRVDSLDEPAGG